MDRGDEDVNMQTREYSWWWLGVAVIGGILLVGCESTPRRDRGTTDDAPSWVDQEAARYKNLFDAAEWDSLAASRQRLVSGGDSGVRFLVKFLLVRSLATPMGDPGPGAAGQAYVDHVVSFRRHAEEELIAIGSPAIPFLAEYARTGRAEGARQCTRVLGFMGSEGLDALVQSAGRAPDETRKVIVEALGETGAPEALPHLVRFLERDSSWQVRGMAARGLGPLGRTVGPERVVPALGAAAGRDPDLFVVQMCARSLVELDSPQGLRAALVCLERLLADDPPQYRNANLLARWMDRVNGSRLSIDVEAWRRELR
jgi:HEAT repeat protein